MVDLLVDHEQKSPVQTSIPVRAILHLLLSFEDILKDLSDFSNHGNEESVVCLIHEAFKVPGLVVELLFDVVLHFVGDQATCNFVGNRTNDREVVRGKVLASFLVCYLEYPNSVIAKLDWDQKYVSHHLMQLLVHRQVLS